MFMTVSVLVSSILNRKRLFSLINDLPNVFDVVTQGKPVKDKHAMDSGSKSKGGMKVITFIFKT